jgi:N utilization substance protein A
MMLTLAENNVRTLDDLADLDNEELLEYLGQHGLTDDTEAGDIIMAARAHWFADEDAGTGDVGTGDAGSEDSGTDNATSDSDAASAADSDS